MGAFIGDLMVAASIWSAPTRSEVYERLGVTPQRCLELRRFVIRDEYHRHNFGSWLLARMESKLPFGITNLISFADPGVGHDGTLYLAANWVADGNTDPSYFYIDEAGYVTLKKTLYNIAHKKHMKAADYAEVHGYVKVPTPPKLRFHRCLR